MKYIDHYRLNMDREDRLREQKFLDSIGPIGRLFDDHLYFCVIMAIGMLAGFLVGFGIGNLL